MRAAMVGDAGHPVGGQAARRVEALTKLKSLLDSGVLTEEQYEAERQNLLQRR
jgi:Short C-terminal domain